MANCDAYHHLTYAEISGVGPVGGFGADDFNERVAEVAEPPLGEHLPRPGEQVLCGTPPASSGVTAADEEYHLRAETVEHLRAGLQRRSGCHPAGAAHLDAVGSGLGDDHAGPVAHHVGQHVGSGIADLIEHLLDDGAPVHQGVAARRGGDLETAIGAHRHDRETRIYPAWGVLPVGEQTTRGLGSAFNQVPGKAATRELIEFLRSPAEFVHQWPKRQRAVDTAAGDDNVRGGIQRRCNRLSTQVGVHTDRLLGNRGAPAHLAHVAVPQLIQPGQQVITADRGDTDIDPGSLRDRAKLSGRRLWVDTPRIGDHPHVLVMHLAQVLADDRDQVAGVALLGVLHPRLGQDGHGDLGERLINQIVTPAVSQQLRSGKIGVTPHPGGTADADRALCHADSSSRT